MIIGFDGSRAFSKNRTGTENYSYQLLLHLAQIDRENSYKVYIRPGSKVEAGLKNIEFITLNYPRLWTQAGLAMQTFKDKIDLLFIPSHTLPIIKRPGLKTIMTVHDLGAEYLPQLHQLKQRIYLNFMTRHQLKSATFLIAVSQATKDDLISRVGIDQNRIKVIYEGINSQLFKSTSNDVQNNIIRKYDIEKGKYFLFVGTVQPRKNLSRLIEAFGLFLKSPEAQKDTTLAIVGSAGWGEKEILSLPKKLGIDNKVKFLGRAEDQDLKALYSGSIAFVFPSLFEGFGLPILEAQACGVPVITSNTSSMPEVAGKGAFFVDPYNTDEIKNALIKVSQDQKLRQSLIKDGKENILRFSWKKCAEETLKLFNQMKEVA